MCNSRVKKWRNILRIFIWLNCICHVAAVFKMTKIECTAVDKSIVNVTMCRLKPVRRDVAEFTTHIRLLEVVRDITMHVEILRKYNTYKPFVINATLDVCSFLRTRRTSPVLRLIMLLIDQYTNLNHTCPYENEIVVERFTPLHENMRIPLPTGDYLFASNWFTRRIKAVSVNVWFSFRELEPWQLPNNIIGHKN